MLYDKPASTELQHPHSIAVVSGKGGTGKTMLVALMAKILSENDKLVTVIDADTGTGGLTYYLGVELVKNTAVGLSNILEGDVAATRPFTQAIRDTPGVRFLGVGDHRRLFRESRLKDLPRKLGLVIADAVESTPRDSVVLIDCRGGIDQESLAVCKVVDSIVLVVEADTTSFQASQHVVDILSLNQMGEKLCGFIVNKVIDDPSVVVRTGTSVFRCTYLSAVPFDINATRAFLIGKLPSIRSPFTVSTWVAVQKIFQGALLDPPGRPYSFSDFKEIGFSNLDSIRGGSVFLALIIALSILLMPILHDMLLYRGDRVVWLVLLTISLGVMACLEPIRRLAGRGVDAYVKTVLRVYSLFRRKRGSPGNEGGIVS